MTDREKAAPTPKTARWLDLVAFLLNRRLPVTREQIFEHVAGYRPESRDDAGETSPGRKPAETARRKFERDKDELRTLGIEIETVDLPAAESDEPRQGYRLRERDFYLPYLELTTRATAAGPYPGLRRVSISTDELAILDRATRRIADRSELALADAAASLRRKLAFDLPLHAGAVERIITAPLPPAVRGTLAVLQSAVSDRCAVRCRYFSIGRDAVEDREIEPYGLFFTWGHWYVVARARDRDALRVFRVDRLSEASRIRGEPAFTVPGDFTIRQWIGRAPWELAEREPETARVRFGFPESRWVLHQRVGQVIDPERNDGGAIIEFQVRDRGPFLRWLLTFGNQAEIQSPAAIAAELSALRAKVASLYAEPSPA